MKFGKSLSFVAFILLCISIPAASRAQWGFQQGIYTPTPASLSAGQGVVCNDKTCSCSLTGDNGFSVSYSTHLYWTGSGEIDYAANVKGVVSVSGSTSANTGARSSSQSNNPIPIEVSGYSSGGNDNYPSPGTAFVYGLYPCTLSASMRVYGSMGFGTPKPYSFAQVSYSLL